MSRGAGGSRPQSTGTVVSSGKIRVDARRAVAKLREHLLVDLRDYTLEIARAASASGAKRIDLGFDADDVELSWVGKPIRTDTLVRLLDHVLVDANNEQARRLRLLALGVNAALGRDPAHVDIYFGSDEASCERIRFEPELLEASDELVEPSQARVARPDGLPPGAIRIQVRRKLGWDVLRRAALGGMPQELVRLRTATTTMPTELCLHGEPFHAEGAARPLLRVELTLADVRRGFLEIMPSGWPAPTVELLEYGVRLVHYGWEPPEGFPSQPHRTLALPVRVLVDADALPTNASRSDLREDAPLYGQLLEASHEAFETALRAMMARIEPARAARDPQQDDADGPAAVEWLSSNALDIENALGTIGCIVMAAWRRDEAPSSLAAELLELPLLADGCGEPCSYLRLRELQAGRLYAYRGEKPLEPDLAWWVRQVLWLRGRVAERVVDQEHMLDAEELIALAREGLARRRQLLAHAPGPVVVPHADDHLAVESFEVSEGQFAGLQGQVALFSASGGRPSTLGLFYEGRQLSNHVLDARWVAMPVDIAVSWDQRFAISFGFDGVQDDAALRGAVWYACQVGALAAGRLAERLGELDGRQAARVRPLLRAALGGMMGAAARLGLQGKDYQVMLPYPGEPLFTANIWPTTEAGRFESLAVLRHFLGSCGALCVATPKVRGKALDGRPVLALGVAERPIVFDALGAEPAEVPYARAVFDEAERQRWPEQRQRAIRRAMSDVLTEQGLNQPFITLDWELPTAHGTVAVASRSAIVRLHAGAQLCTQALCFEYGGVVVVVDDERVVPTEDWCGVLHEPSAGWSVVRLQLDFLTEIVATLAAGGRQDGKVAGLPAPGQPLGEPLTAYLLCAARKLGAELEQWRGDDDIREQRKELYAQLLALPLLEMLDEAGQPELMSISQLFRAHPAPKRVPVLPAAPGFATIDWKPLVLGVSSVLEDAPVFDALVKLLDGRCHDARWQLSSMKKAAERERGRRALLKQPRVDPRKPGKLADERAPVIYRASSFDGAGAVTVAASLKADIAFGEVSYANFELLYDGRLVGNFESSVVAAPVAARVGLDEHALFLADWAGLGSRGRKLVEAELLEAAAMLALRLLRPEQAEADLLSLADRRLVRLLVHVLGPNRKAEQHKAIMSSIRKLAIWPTIRGRLTSLAAARRVGEVYVGRRRYPQWVAAKRAAAQLDRPIIHLPVEQRDGLRWLLGKLGSKLRDVSVAVERLQARRRSGGELEAPVLPGKPPHPALRTSVQLLSLSGAGELEIVVGPRSRLTLMVMDGPPREVEASFSVPVHAVVRVEAVDVAVARAEAIDIVERVVRRLLFSLTTKLEELPSFVHDHLRAEMITTCVSKKKANTRLGKRLLAAAVLPDIRGGWHSAAHFQAEAGDGEPGRVWFTTTRPPYPERDYKRVVLRLESEQVHALRQLLSLYDMGTVIAGDLAGEQKRRAAQRPSMSLDGADRAKSLWTTRLREGISGELGILRPDAASARGLHVHTTRRPLCNLSDGVGWPIVALLNDDSLSAGRYFDRIRTEKQRVAVVAKMRSVADELLAQQLAPPRLALSSCWIDTSQPLDSESEPEGMAHGGMLAIGSLWLAPRWQGQHALSVWTAGTFSGSVPLKLSTLRGSPHLLHALPMQGKLLVLSAARSADLPRVLSEIARRRFSALIEEAIANATTAEATAALEAYRWNLWLLGIPAGPEPQAPSAAGGQVGPKQILDELSCRGRIWFTEKKGQAEGDFPDAAPPFVLLDDSSSRLLEVLRARGVGSMLRELGGAQPPSLGQLVAQSFGQRMHSRDERDTLPPPRQDASPASMSPPAPQDAPRAVDFDTSTPIQAPEPAGPSWLRGLARRVVAVFEGGSATEAGDESAQQPAGPDVEPLVFALSEAITRLRLSAEVAEVVLVDEGGRAVRFNKRAKRVILDRSRPVVAALCREPIDPIRLRLLTAAAVGEINRAHRSVTAAEELVVLRKLLAAPKKKS